MTQHICCDTATLEHKNKNTAELMYSFEFGNELLLSELLQQLLYQINHSTACVQPQPRVTTGTL